MLSYINIEIFSEEDRKNNSVFIYINNVDVAVLGVLCFFWYYSNS